MACLMACLVTATVAGSAVASPSPVRLDREQGLRFDLNGSTLTVGLAPQEGGKPPDARKKLWGERVRAGCSPTFNVTKAARRRVVTAVRHWPRGQLQLSFSFERDISDRVKWCLIEAASGGDIAAVDFAVFIRIYAGGASDRRMGQDLRRYLLRNAASTPWLRRVVGIVVDGGVVGIATQLRRNQRGKDIARQLCNLIQGSDVADFTPGHTVFGPDGVVIRVCPKREGPP